MKLLKCTAILCVIGAVIIFVRLGQALSFDAECPGIRTVMLVLNSPANPSNCTPPTPAVPVIINMGGTIYGGNTYTICSGSPGTVSITAPPGVVLPPAATPISVTTVQTNGQICINSGFTHQIDYINGLGQPATYWIICITTINCTSPTNMAFTETK